MSRNRQILRSARSAGLGALATVMLGGGLGGLLTADAAVNTGARAVFVPISPCRLFDTRPGVGVGPRTVPLQGGAPVVWNVLGANGNCTIPADATSVVMNMTIVNPTTAGFLTVWPSDQGQPVASSMNWIPGQAATPNAITSKVSSAGQISTFVNSGTVDLIADINGYYVDHNHDDRYYTKSQIGASFLIETGDISLPPGQFTTGQLNCPAGTVVVGSGFAIAGTFSFVKSFGGFFVGYFLDNGHAAGTTVSAQAICAQSPGPPTFPINAAGGQVSSSSSSAAADWARDLADRENAALAEGLVHASTQVNVTTTKMP